MNIIQLNSSITLPAGSLLSLDHDQADAREGLLIAVDIKLLAKARAELAAAKQGLANLKKPGVVASPKELDAAAERVAARRAKLAEVRGIWQAKLPIFFKTGEQIGYEGNTNAREIRSALGIGETSEPVADALENARAQGVATGRAQLLAEVTAYNDALDVAEEAHEAVAEAEAALAAETEEAKKPELKKALAAARKTATDADAAAAKLKPQA